MSPQLQRVPASVSRDTIVAALNEDGGVIIEGFLSSDQVNRLNADIEPAMATKESGSKHGDEFAKDFHGSNTKRLTNVVSLSPKVFGQEILDKDLVHDVCDKVFTQDSGTYWMTAGQVIEIGPGNKAQPLHRDQSNFPLWSKLGPSTPEATVNFLIALSNFTEENGATRVLPGSHKWDDFSQLGTQQDTIPALLKAGDALCISGKIVHGGGSNRTQDEKRRALAFAISCSYLTPEEAYPFMIPMDIIKTLSPRAQAMIGFRSQFPKGCPGLWQWDYEELANHIGLGVASA